AAAVDLCEEDDLAVRQQRRRRDNGTLIRPEVQRRYLRDGRRPAADRLTGETHQHGHAAVDDDDSRALRRAEAQTGRVVGEWTAREGHVAGVVQGDHVVKLLYRVGREGRREL